MCHAHLNPDLLMREAEARYRAAAAVPVQGDQTAPETVPAELMGGLRGTWARIVARVRFVRRASV